MSENLLFKTALTKAMALCSRRELCCSEIETKLDSWGLAGLDCEKIINVLVKENFLNQERFAKAFAKDKFNYNKWGKVKITAHLRLKNIPSHIIKSALDSIDNETYKRVMNEVIKNHIRTIKSKNTYDLKAKLLRYGLSKGFESSLLYDILNDIED